jgi:citrate synthase
MREIIERFQRCGISQPLGSDLDLSSRLDLEDTTPFLSDEPDPRADAMLNAVEKLEKRSLFIDFVQSLATKHGFHPTSDGVLAALCATLAWPSLVRKRISKKTLINMPWHVRIVGAMVGASAPASAHGGCSFVGVPCAEIIADWGFSETAFLSLFGRRPDERERFAFNVVVSMLISNGPGTISAQGAKGAVSSDGPESTEQIHINKCYLGFLTHSGFAHGGNGHEGMTFLINLFKDTGLIDPMDPDPKIDIQRIALEFATGFLRRRMEKMEIGESFKEKIPCIGHPVFKGEKINQDPREVFVKDLLERSGFTNVFLEFYHELVHALFQTKATKNVFAVNMDAAIAATLLGMLWQRHCAGEISRRDLQSAAFTTFLFGRMLGSAAEIEDHINRGLDMDTRTRASDCTHIN